jgi:hypothetical protein
VSVVITGGQRCTAVNMCNGIENPYIKMCNLLITFPKFICFDVKSIALSVVIVETG